MDNSKFILLRPSVLSSSLHLQAMAGLSALRCFRLLAGNGRCGVHTTVLVWFGSSPPAAALVGVKRKQSRCFCCQPSGPRLECRILWHPNALSKPVHRFYIVRPAGCRIAHHCGVAPMWPPSCKSHKLSGHSELVLGIHGIWGMRGRHRHQGGNDRLMPGCV